MPHLILIILLYYLLPVQCFGVGKYKYVPFAIGPLYRKNEGHIRFRIHMGPTHNVDNKYVLLFDDEVGKS